MSTAIVKLNGNNVLPRKMSNEELGSYVASESVGVLKRLDVLKPFFAELWNRFEELPDGETINGCRTRTEFCDKILHRSRRSVQYILYGRTPAKLPSSTSKRKEQEEPKSYGDVEDAGDLTPTTPIKNKNFNKAGTHGDFKDKPHLNLFLRRLMAIGAVGTTSPFPKVAEDALKECPPEAAKGIIYNLNLAARRLKEYQQEFEVVQDGKVKSTALVKDLEGADEADEVSRLTRLFHSPSVSVAAGRKGKYFVTFTNLTVGQIKKLAAQVSI